ncbi:hypothetical protein FI667_g10161, partial [Globisporangium splendens]
MEQWRRLQNPKHKAMVLILAAITLGGCGIWCTHFTGMTAIKLTLDDGTILVVDFELGLTVLSLIFPVAGVLLGLMIASKDPFFLEIEQSRRKDMLIMALFSRLWRIGIGGAFAALGVLGMHYLGMLAQRMNANMELHPGIVTVSVVVAFLTANAAFWIIFRAWRGGDHRSIARCALDLLLAHELQCRSRDPEKGDRNDNTPRSRCAEFGRWVPDDASAVASAVIHFPQETSNIRLACLASIVCAEGVRGAN